MHSEHVVIAGKIMDRCACLTKHFSPIPDGTISHIGGHAVDPISHIGGHAVDPISHIGGHAVDLISHIGGHAVDSNCN